MDQLEPIDNIDNIDNLQETKGAKEIKQAEPLPLYPATESEVNFPAIEEKILKFWQEENIFTKSIAKNSKQEFVFYDGPPFANGLPHYGHLLTGFIKDAIARYQTMLGHKVERRFGWDCHGLPAEMAAEKTLGISGQLAIKEFGIAKFNEQCRSSVMKYAQEWEQYVTRQARWVDFKNDYKTMDISFMESVIWAFKELYKKGLIYQSVKVVPYSWACETPLSNFETRLDNSYRPKTSKAVTVAFELIFGSGQNNNQNNNIFGNNKKCYLLAWTTTPWTLTSNMLLAINANDPELKYIAIEKDDNYYIAADFYWKNNNETSLVEDKSNINIKLVPAEKLLNLKYKPLFPYFAHIGNAFYIVNASFVLKGEGTGIVHVAPGFGEDDFELAKEHKLEIICPVDSGGKFTSLVPEFTGKQVFETEDAIIKALKEKGSWVKTEQYIHNYPHCWRTDTPLIYKAVPSWYVAVSTFKEQMTELNKEINWVPAYIKEGLFGNWLENAKDWAISRNRFWGTPIPVWQSSDPKYPRIDVYGSIAEISEAFQVSITDLHKPFIDQLTRKNPDDPTGKSIMRRVEDVFDCWFESGSMPFAQVHYPFENKEWFEGHFPADFITEYIAQTRGWFYTLMVLSTAIFGKPPFKNCICHGVILDVSGQKLSKRLNNYTDPLEVFHKYGADALRFLMLSSSAMQGGDLLLDKDANMVKETLRLVIKPIWSAYHFFTTYANFHSYVSPPLKNFCSIIADEPNNNELAIEAENKTKTKAKAKNVMDIYILAKCNIAIAGIKKSLDDYNTNIACKIIVEFFDSLNNWYIRRCRERFVEGEQAAFNILYNIFDLILRAMAPLLPLITEEIWLGLGNKNSIHLENFPIPIANELLEEEKEEAQTARSKLIQMMDKVREICNAALFIRNKKNIRIRQPLRELAIKSSDGLINNLENLEAEAFLEIIKDEINVKNIIINPADFNIDFKLKLKFPVIGKRYPGKVKEMTQALKDNLWQRASEKVWLGETELLTDEYEFALHTTEDNIKGLEDNQTAIKLTIDIDEELKIEGLARDLIRFIQQTRKEGGLKIQNKAILKIWISESGKTEGYLRAIEVWGEIIKKATYLSKIILLSSESASEFSNSLINKKIDNILKIGIGPE